MLTLNPTADQAEAGVKMAAFGSAADQDDIQFGVIS